VSSREPEHSPLGTSSSCSLSLSPVKTCTMPQGPSSGLRPRRRKARQWT
jgi:hypothetical protein